MTNILIVEDESDWQSSIKNLLEKYDEKLSIQIASNAADALRKSSRTKFDLAIIDLRLQRTDDSDYYSGLALASALRNFQPHIKMVLITALKLTLGQIFKSLRYSGFTDVVEKTEIESRLVKAVRAALNEPSYEKNTSHLTISIEDGQPVQLRAWGEHVISLHTRTALDIPTQDYIILSEDIYGTPRTRRRRQVKNIGRGLYEKIFMNDIDVITQFTKAETKVNTKNRVLSIYFEIDRNLISLPLEFIFKEREFLILKHPVARFIAGISPAREALSPGLLSQIDTLRILVIGSNTEPAIPGVDREINQLRGFLEERSEVELRTLPTEKASLPTVKRYITEWEPDIVHYAGHGLYDPDRTEQSALFFWSEENKQGECIAMSATGLKNLLADSSVRFIYLSCCEGAATGTEANLVNDDFLGIADAAVEAGVPSVLGFRWPLSDVTAPLMTRTFYNSLLDKGSLPIAILEARRALADRDRDDITWLSPILIHQT